MGTLKMKNILKGILLLLPSIAFFVTSTYLCVTDPTAFNIMRIEFYVFCGIVFATLLFFVLGVLFLCLRNALLYLFKVNLSLKAPQK
jgi:hypothetical protein